MPTYTYRCGACGDYEVWQSIHADALTACAYCDRPVDKVMTPPNISASALATRGEEVVAIEAKEQRWQRDMPAYARFRRQGIQPKAIDGADEMEARARTRFQIETGIYVSSEEKVQEGMGMAQELGFNAP